MGLINPNDFMEYMGYRQMVVQGKISECVDAIRNGADHITLDRGDLTDSELEYLKKEIEERTGAKLKGE